MPKAEKPENVEEVATKPKRVPRTKTPVEAVEVSPVVEPVVEEVAEPVVEEAAVEPVVEEVVVEPVVEEVVVEPVVEPVAEVKVATVEVAAKKRATVAGRAVVQDEAGRTIEVVEDAELSFDAVKSGFPASGHGKYKLMKGDLTLFHDGNYWLEIAAHDLRIELVAEGGKIEFRHHEK